MEISEINIDGVKYPIKDENLNNVLNDLVQVLHQNNNLLVSRINDLNTRLEYLESLHKNQQNENS